MLKHQKKLVICFKYLVFWRIILYQVFFRIIHAELMSKMCYFFYLDFLLIFIFNTSWLPSWATFMERFSSMAWYRAVFKAEVTVRMDFVTWLLFWNDLKPVNPMVIRIENIAIEIKSSSTVRPLFFDIMNLLDKVY